MIKAVVLGTSSMVPTKERNVSGTYVEFNGEGILFDCGEGTQRQMSMLGISRSKVKKLLITHWHADHVAGIMGLIQTIGNKEQDVHLTVFGPTGTKKHMDHLMKASIFDQQIAIDIHEVMPEQPEIIFENSDYQIEAVTLKHGTPIVGYSLIEKDRRRMRVKKMEELGIPPGPIYAKLQRGQDVTVDGKKIKADDVTYVVQGKKFTYIVDTLFCQNAIDLAQDADVLLCEATYQASHEDKAMQYRHMTSQQAGQIASMAGVKELYLTHFSQRYGDLSQLHNDAKDVFAQAKLARDLMVIKI